MEERNVFTQKLMCWDFFLIAAIVFLGMFLSEVGTWKWLRWGILIATAAGAVIMYCLTYHRKVSDVFHGGYFMVFMGTLSVMVLSYYDEMVVLHLLLLLIMLTTVIYRKFYLCKFMLVEMLVIYGAAFLLMGKLGIGEDIPMARMLVASIGTMAGGFTLSCVIGTEEKNRRVITENRRTSLDMLRLVEMKKEEAEHLADVKSVFLANMSHEIRTPINAVLGMNEMILRECEQPEILEYADNIERAGETLLSLIEDILDISRIESGRVEIIPAEYEIQVMANDLVNMLGIKAEEKGLELKKEFPSDMPGRLYGDELRIKQILINVLNNAVKYTKQGTITFHLDWEKIGESDILMKCQVTDTGIGMKEKELEHIFDAFQRLDMENNRSIEGSGLGMTITSRYLELMNGTISIESEYGKGTRVSLEIPQKVSGWEAADFTEKKEGETERKKYQVSFTAPEARILVVDDNSMNLAVIQGMLKKTEIQIDSVLSGMESIEAVQRETYDLILMDHMMPQMDGIEAMKLMRRLNANKSRSAPIIVLTANVTVGSEQMYLREGFDDYLSKPVKAERLEEMLLSYLPKHLIEKEYHLDRKKEAERKEGFPKEEKEELRRYDLDVEEGLSYLDHDMKQYAAAAEIFLRHSQSKRQKMEQMLKEGDISGYTMEVHALKSNARILGSKELSGKAKELEEHGFKEDLEWLRSGHGVLEELWDKTVAGLEYLLSRLDTQEEEIVAGLGMEKEEFRRQKERLAELIRQYEEEEAEVLIERLRKQGLDREQLMVLKQVKERLEEFSYDEALELLESGENE